MVEAFAAVSPLGSDGGEGGSLDPLALRYLAAIWDFSCDSTLYSTFCIWNILGCTVLCFDSLVCYVSSCMVRFCRILWWVTIL